MVEKTNTTTIKSKEPAKNENKRILKGMRKVGASDLQQELIAYAFARCGLECVLTWEGEGGWVVDKKGYKANSNGTRDYGLCQMNSQFHSDFIFKNKRNGEFSKEFLNPYIQLDRCIGIWNDAKKHGTLRTKFYAYNVINVRPGVRDEFEYIY